jgi:outer membrane lipoprotein-sorting protein
MKRAVVIETALALYLLAGLTAAGMADAKGDAILRQAFKKLGTARTYAADVAMTFRAPSVRTLARKGTVAALKPNFLRVELKAPRAQLFIADGKAYYNYLLGAPLYVKEPLPPKPVEFLGVWEGEIDAFFGGEQNAGKVTAAYGGSEKVGGVDCDIVRASVKGQNRTIVYSIGKADRLIRRAVILIPGPNRQTATQTNLLSNIRLNVPLKPSDFTFKPPAKAREYKARPNARPGIS